jgi:hypothetical protein
MCFSYVILLVLLYPFHRIRLVFEEELKPPPNTLLDTKYSHRRPTYRHNLCFYFHAIDSKQHAKLCSFSYSIRTASDKEMDRGGVRIRDSAVANIRQI